MHVLAEAERDGCTCLPARALLADAARAARRATLAEDADRRARVRAATSVARGASGSTARATAELEAELAERVRRAARAARPASGCARRRAAPRRGADAPTSSPPSSRRRWRPRSRTGCRSSPAARAPARPRRSGRSPRAAAERGARVMLVAPTGRAAMRMTEASGLRASTVHSALGWIPGEGPTHDEHDPLQLRPADRRRDLDGQPRAARDAAARGRRRARTSCSSATPTSSRRSAPASRSPSWSPPSAVPTARLTHIFRQAAGSMIVQGAHAIRRGEPPSFSAARGHAPRPVPDRARRRRGRRCEEIVSLVSRAAAGALRGRPGRATSRCSRPSTAASSGSTRSTARCATALNPDGQPVRGGRLRIGDKLMMTGRNLHELGLMNGTLLRLLDEVDAAADDDDDDGGGAARSAPTTAGLPARRPRRPTACGSPTPARCTAARGSSCRSR